MQVVRLAELHATYADKVQRCTKQLDAEAQDMIAEGMEVDEEFEDEKYERRVEAGLSCLQYIDFIAAEAFEACGPEVKEFMVQQFRIKGASIEEIGSVLEEYADNVGDTEKDDSLAKRLLYLKSRI
jgi:beta-catenin-like protein 1